MRNLTTREKCVLLEMIIERDGEYPTFRKFNEAALDLLDDVPGIDSEKRAEIAGHLWRVLPS